jgi:hypothetical protein
MAKRYSVGIYVDGIPVDQCQVTGSSPRVAVNKALRGWFATEYRRDRQLQYMDEQLTIQIVRREE